MPKYYCDYCDIFLTHDSSSVRKAHNTGWKHINQVAAYYQALEPSKTQEIIDAITAAHDGQLPVIQTSSYNSQAYGDRRGDSYGDRRGESYGDRRGGDSYGDRRGGDSYGDRRGGDSYGDRRGDSYGAPRRNERRDYSGGRAPREGRGFGDRSRGPPVHGRPFRQHEQGPPMHPPPHMRFPPGPPPGFGEALSAPPQLNDRHRSYGT
ncbi:U1 small nuclear ribonucleoprotein C [Coemansia erecta]|nr:U1 small nuclear ribonucleoprotein C [Coemansia erecta]